MVETLLVLAGLLTQAGPDDLAAELRKLRIQVLPDRSQRMLSQAEEKAIRDANQASTRAWNEIRSKEDWERFRAVRLRSLRESLGAPEEVPQDLHVRITRTLEGAGHKIENLVFESRPGLLVTANLYVPVPERASMPGILIVHSHHNPKTQGELQDMGVTWARLGCLVLVMDQLGHGERRQHPFVDAKSYPEPFRVDRQDYHHRYVTAGQLHLVGESLIGWMVWDLMRGVDLLLTRPGIDKNRIALFGSVAGGGDPAAVTGALDPRIAVVGPFNFGGPQPESRYPLPEDAETSFNYAGGGSWESTRNLLYSIRDGFLPWTIVGSVAPRRLIYGHEFSWDRDHDPVWRRLEKIYGFYDAGGHLSAATGRGLLKGKPPEASHCNNIGPLHRQGIYPPLKKWFDIDVPEKDAQERRPAADLACLPADLKPRRAHELARERAAAVVPSKDPSTLKSGWKRVLGMSEPFAEVQATHTARRALGGATLEEFELSPEMGVLVPVILLLPPQAKEERVPVVVGIAQGGKQAFLQERADEIAALIRGGAAVCLPDLRGTGETRPGDSRDRRSESTDLSATEFMRGRTLLGGRLMDLRSLVRLLRSRSDLDARRIALWGDSFAPPNPPDRRFDVPLDTDKLPRSAEPMGALVALLGALFESDVRAVFARGGLDGYRSILDQPFFYVPHDVLVPGVLTFGDVKDVAAAVAPRPIRLQSAVDGLNRRVSREALEKLYGADSVADEATTAAWLLEGLKKN